MFTNVVVVIAVFAFCLYKKAVTKEEGDESMKQKTGVDTNDITYLLLNQCFLESGFLVKEFGRHRKER